MPSRKNSRLLRWKVYAAVCHMRLSCASLLAKRPFSSMGRYSYSALTYALAAPGMNRQRNARAGSMVVPAGTLSMI